MRVLVAGSRSLNPTNPQLDYALSLLMASKPRAEWTSGGLTIVHGAARGADLAGDRWARARSYGLSVHPVTGEEWQTVGKRAGIERNQRMLDSGLDGALVFWDGKSRGTQHMLGLLRKANVLTVVVQQDPTDDRGETLFRLTEKPEVLG